MNSNGILRKHWFHVAVHFMADGVFFFSAFVLAMLVRFGHEGQETIWTTWPSLLAGSAFFGTVIYIAGLYSTHSANKGFFERSIILFGCVVAAVLLIIGMTYATSARPLGRGVMLIGGATAYLLAVLHHASLLHALRTTRERVAYIVSGAFDEVETRLFANFGGRNLDFAGIITCNGFLPSEGMRVLGTVDEITEIVRREKIDRVLCTSDSLSNAKLTRAFCKLRYSGTTVMPLIILCEEVEQYVPLELITSEWLLNASGEPHLIYIKKVKRFFDIVCSAIGLVLGAPLVGLGALAIKLTSPGPVFYRQVRAGRFGRTFEMTKLRTMRVDAEKDGVKWCEKQDPRITFVGHFLRRYRIDEIPQLWHVLTGDMSFVGPRPERPEIIEKLAREIPYYEERQMVQPGITGWAQVSYPYGASVLDSRRKLEFDLYYMKHMSLFLDVFIMLDTVRIVLAGGATHAKRAESVPGVIEEWERLRAAQTSVGGGNLGAA
jgi:exopolysaccharide biosynthesis polyprenyl glycosylphosphotransferase